MKHTFTVILMIVTVSVNAQWVQQYTGTTANLYDIEFLNRYTGWCVGDGGTCLKTTNGGINWIQMNHPVGTKPLRAVHVVDSNVVYFVGNFETIFKTTNGGINWEIIRNGPWGQGLSYFGLYFLNKDSGWICGNGNKVLRTKNGGQTFDSGYVSSNWLYDIYFKDANTGCVTSEGKIFRTTNGGTIWYTSLFYDWAYIFMKISFVDNLYGWIVGHTGVVFKTTNFGDNWSIIDTIPLPPNAFYSGIHFIDKDTGFIGGAINRLYKTTDGGFSWSRENTSTNNDQFEDIKFVNDSVGWIAATSGVILNTTTGGQALTGVANHVDNIANDYVLHQNYPNPFNNQTIIKYDIPKYCDVRILIYDILGRKSDVIINGIYQPGKYEIYFSPKELSSGIYFYSMEVDGIAMKTKKLIIKK